jgi:hypothetical protein
MYQCLNMGMNVSGSTKHISSDFCRGFRWISDISSWTRDSSSDLFCWSNMLKSKSLSRYLKDSPILIVVTKQLLVSSFGRFWVDLPLKLSWYQRDCTYQLWLSCLPIGTKLRIGLKGVSWFSDSWPVISAALSANWNQWMGLSKLSLSVTLVVSYVLN